MLAALTTKEEGYRDAVTALVREAGWSAEVKGNGMDVPVKDKMSLSIVVAAWLFPMEMRIEFTSICGGAYWETALCNEGALVYNDDVGYEDVRRIVHVHLDCPEEAARAIVEELERVRSFYEQNPAE